MHYETTQSVNCCETVPSVLSPALVSSQMMSALRANEAAQTTPSVQFTATFSLFISSVVFCALRYDTILCDERGSSQFQISH